MKTYSQFIVEAEKRKSEPQEILDTLSREWSKSYSHKTGIN
jgi:hypothetical protein